MTDALGNVLLGEFSATTGGHRVRSRSSAAGARRDVDVEQASERMLSFARARAA